ncbi:Oidioi.mRNA.OKI2018_I69.chr1.g836.t1.cds [Oikopleura dioica]|nr:Oidioi.mRNA.OKI2018_I69.chr1.g836.t1.cds [Oikopleura dioica]
MQDSPQDPNNQTPSPSTSHDFFDQQPSFANNELSSPPSNRREKQREPCPVCGDVVSGYHYGILSCESCKGFFKRIVQLNKKYYCSNNDQCTITKTTRKKCSSCRYNKCILLGMKREALRIGGNRGGRSALKEEYDKDRANRKKKRLVSSSSDQNHNEHPFQPLEMKNEMTDFDPKPANFLTSFDSILGMTNLDIIKDITSSWIPEEQVAERARKAVEGMIFVNKYSVIDHVIRMDEQVLFSKVLWAKQTAAFRELSTDDQVKALCKSWPHVMCLDQIYRQLWFSDEKHLLLVSGRKISQESFSTYFDPGAQKMAEEIMRITTIYKKLRIDRTELICLMMFSMFILDERPQHQLIAERIKSCLLDHIQTHFSDQPARFHELMNAFRETSELARIGTEWFREKKLYGMIPSTYILSEVLDNGNSLMQA